MKLLQFFGKQTEVEWLKIKNSCKNRTMAEEIQKSTIAKSWKYNATLLEFESLGEDSPKENTLLYIRTGINNPDLIIFSHKNFYVMTDSCRQTKREGGLDTFFTYNQSHYRMFLAPGSLIATCEKITRPQSGFVKIYEF